MTADTHNTQELHPLRILSETLLHNVWAVAPGKAVSLEK